MPTVKPVPSTHSHIAMFMILILALASVANAGPNKVKTAKAAGNDQTTFAMTLNATKCPFCNTTEAVGDPKDPTRSTAAAYIPALIAPGSCGEPTAKWELSQDPFTSRTLLRDGRFQTVDWKNVVSGLYISKFSDFATTVSTQIKAGQQTATLAASTDLIAKSLHVGDLVLIDNVGSELAKVTKIDNQTVSIQAGGENSGWQTDHVPNVPFRVIAEATDCEAGKAEILLDRAFRYGFCDKNVYNLGSEDPNADLTISVLDPNFDKNQADFYVVNVVVWKKIDAAYSSSSSTWYVYNRGDHGHWYRQKLPYFDGSLRVYGSKKPIGLIAIHVRANNDKTPPWGDFQKLGISYSVSVKSKTPANVSDLLTALSVISGGKAPQAQANRLDPDGFYGTMLFTAKAAADITITAQVDFSKLGSQKPITDSTSQSPRENRPAYIAGLADRPADYERLASPQQEKAVRDASPVKAASFDPHVQLTSFRYSSEREFPLAGQGTGNQKNQSGNQKNTGTNSSQGNQSSSTQPPQNPSVDCQPTMSSGKQSPCKFTATINDEDLYHWDVSFAVPFHAISELQYDQPTGNGSAIVPKNVTRLNAYGLFDVYPVATDIVTPPLISVPHLFVGLPISGKVFNKPMFGAGDTFNFSKISFLKFLPIQFGFFGSVVYNKQFNQIPGTTGAGNVTGHRVWKGSYGIEIPVTQFKNLLSSKNSNNGSSTSNKSSSTKTN